MTKSRVVSPESSFGAEPEGSCNSFVLQLSEPARVAALSAQLEELPTKDSELQCRFLRRLHKDLESNDVDLRAVAVLLRCGLADALFKLLPSAQARVPTLACNVLRNLLMLQIRDRHVLQRAAQTDVLLVLRECLCSGTVPTRLSAAQCLHLIFRRSEEACLNEVAPSIITALCDLASIDDEVVRGEALASFSVLLDIGPENLLGTETKLQYVPRFVGIVHEVALHALGQAIYVRAKSVHLRLQLLRLPGLLPLLFQFIKQPVPAMFPESLASMRAAEVLLALCRMEPVYDAADSTSLNFNCMMTLIDSGVVPCLIEAFEHAANVRNVELREAIEDYLDAYVHREPAFDAPDRAARRMAQDAILMSVTALMGCAANVSAFRLLRPATSELSRLFVTCAKFSASNPQLIDTDVVKVPRAKGSHGCTLFAPSAVDSSLIALRHLEDSLTAVSLERARACRENGNRMFKEGNLEAAMWWYTTALELIGFQPRSTDEPSEMIRERNDLHLLRAEIFRMLGLAGFAAADLHLAARFRSKPDRLFRTKSFERPVSAMYVVLGLLFSAFSLLLGAAVALLALAFKPNGKIPDGVTRLLAAFDQRAPPHKLPLSQADSRYRGVV
eukprot:TRINITY_DN7371_c0_g1_i1.p1 TRINITY_DN7371_c0_g1~~TRINITY_DN7371_c0_g1_i1.p1  ORF type:complete len:616 (-),score=130.67 TRINITY_DN7371_c0_g1_i1:975-2822(-)